MTWVSRSTCAAGEMRALAEAGQRRRVDAVAGGAQPLGDALPHPVALPGAVNEDERCRAHEKLMFNSFSALRRVIAS